MQRSSRMSGVVWAVSALLMLFAGASAQAATRTMVGSVGVINPSVAPPWFFLRGPHVLGKKVGPYAPDTGWTTVSVAGATASTFVGRQVTLPANKLNFTGAQFRNFAAFPTVANLTKTYSSVQPEATFAVGQGALGQCPGNGCTFSSYTTTTGGVTNTVTVPGTAISWCPPAGGEPVGTPSPGTPNDQVGDWNCASQQGAGAGALNVRIGISNAQAANRFGGTFSMLENTRQNVWRVLVQPGTDGVAEVVRNGDVRANQPWVPGQENFGYITNGATAGPRLNARLDASGAVSQTLGCVNGVGTPGQTFVPGGAPFPYPGSNCGTGIDNPPGQFWGFRMTTGDVEGSDPWPFISVTSAVPPGTAFAPNVNPRTPGQGFFFTRMGTDNVVGTRRNLVLIGGGVLRDPASGNLAFDVTDLRLELTVPEPVLGLGVVAGAIGLVTLARRRSES